MSAYEALSQAEVDKRLKELAGWKQVEKSLVFIRTFPAYLDALEFVNKVGKTAEENDHHPDIMMNFKRVEVRYWTHKARGITELDFKMAHKVDEISSSFSR